MTGFCGLDFGTSNSTIGIERASGCDLVILENNKPTIRSAIFCDAEHKEWVFGQEGINRYLASTPGRLLMALKSVLGSSLMDDETLIFNEFMPYSRILSQFIHYLKTQAEKAAGEEITQVVLGRPVHFHDTDIEQDRLAQNTLEKLAKDLGFKEVSFQFEPIAAALTYEMSIQEEQLALIIDMGGGTSDFTVIRLRPNNATVDRSADVLANSGIHIAGTDFDQKLSTHSVMPLLGMGTKMQGSSSVIEVPGMYYHDLTTWHTLANLYSAKTIAHVRSLQNAAFEKPLLARLIRVLQMRAGHHILDAVETTKQNLSEKQAVDLDLSFIEDDLHVNVERALLNSVIDDHLQRIIKSILQTVEMANIKPDAINAIFYTGGSTKIPLIRDSISPLFPNASIVQGDAFGSVGLGLTIDAKRKFGTC